MKTDPKLVTMSILLVLISAFMDKLYLKNFNEGMTDVEKNLSDMIEKLPKVELQMRGQNNNLEKYICLI